MDDYASFLSELTELNLPAVSKMTLLTIQSFPTESFTQWAKRIGIPCAALTEQVIPSLEELGFLSRETPTTFIIHLYDKRNNKKKKLPNRKDRIFEIEYFCKKFKAAWEQRYKTHFTFNPRDRYRIEELLRKVGLAELERRMELYFKDEWSMKKGGSLSLFASTQSTLAGKQHEDTPVCQGDKFNREVENFERALKGNALSLGNGGSWT